MVGGWEKEKSKGARGALLLLLRGAKVVGRRRDFWRGLASAGALASKILAVRAIKPAPGPTDKPENVDLGGSW